MKILKYGEVRLTITGPKIEGWNVEREPDDPKDATDEQLLLGFAILWARQQFEAAVKDAQLDVFREERKRKLAAIKASH